MMVDRKILENITIKELIEKYPFSITYFSDNKLNIEGFENKTFIEFISHFSQEEIEDWAMDIDKLSEGLIEYINIMLRFLGIKEEKGIESLTILPGFDKSHNKENFEKLTIYKSEIVSIVGATGSGKSRLLGDIEWTAQNDTPTGRTILINDEIPDKKWRFSSGNKLVAQLSQNMNFVMDLTVYEFLELHAKSRLVENEEEVIKNIIEAANNLAGEKFDINTPVTSLSGGQSRALMIADAAILSKSPIVLIDEIENAGIDRKKALNLLVSSDKIVLMATHDPNLALMANKRIVIKNGGILKVIETSKKEKKVLKKLEEMDSVIQNMRTHLRNGEEIDY